MNGKNLGTCYEYMCVLFWHSIRFLCFKKCKIFPTICSECVTYQSNFEERMKGHTLANCQANLKEEKLRFSRDVEVYFRIFHQKYLVRERLHWCNFLLETKPWNWTLFYALLIQIESISSTLLHKTCKNHTVLYRVITWRVQMECMFLSSIKHLNRN